MEAIFSYNVVPEPPTATCNQSLIIRHFFARSMQIDTKKDEEHI